MNKLLRLSSEQSTYKDPATASVLIIEDSEDDREYLVRLLQNKLSFDRVSEATNATDALTMAATADCALLDYRLGREDGLEVLASLVQAHPDLPVIMLTGQGCEVTAVKAMQSGAMDYLVKDVVTADTLRRSIMAAMDRAELHSRLRHQADEQEHFLRSMVHDFRAPLRHVGILAGYLKEDIDSASKEDVFDTANSIIRAAGRANELLEALQRYAAATDPVVAELVNMNDVVGEVAAMYQREGANVTVEKLPIVAGSPPELAQLFQNLVGNGLKHNLSDSPWVRISAVSKATQHLFFVDDNGPGVQKTKQSDIFRPFTRLTSVEGTGLGLAICQRIAERHGGKLSVESLPGAGSRFVVELPCR